PLLWHAITLSSYSSSRLPLYLHSFPTRRSSDLLNTEEILPMFRLIVESAFGLREVAGAALGTVIVQGVRRGMFSNEAGLGSAPKDRKSTRLNSSHVKISYAVFCLKKKTTKHK